MRHINGLAWCSQAVMEAAEELSEAAIGTAPKAASAERESGFEPELVAAYLEDAATALDAATIASEACTATPLGCANWPPRRAWQQRKTARFKIAPRLRIWKRWNGRLQFSKRSSLAALTAAAPEQLLGTSKSTRPANSRPIAAAWE